jgi:hypothetical protein
MPLRRVIPSLLLLVCLSVRLAAQTPVAAPAPPHAITTLTLRSETLHTGVKHFGINLSGQDYYSSGQVMRNLIYRNPGFEGEMWQSILHCKTVTDTTCTDENPYTTWPADFLKGGTFTVLNGAVKGSKGMIAGSTAASAEAGVTITLKPAPQFIGRDNFILVSVKKPGDAEAGWWSRLEGGAKLATEFKDLSPHSPGKQALRIDAAGKGQSAEVLSFFDSLEGHSFVQLKGRYTLQFRAKSLSGEASVTVKLERLDMTHGRHSLFSQVVPLTKSWQDYTFPFDAAEDGTPVGTVALGFTFAGSSALLDDVALTEAAAPDNPTVFRDAVVSTLRELHPGILRYTDGDGFGSSLENVLAAPSTRLRSGYSTQSARQEDIAIGLNEILVLCREIGAEPWYSFPIDFSPAEISNLVDFLAGPVTTAYGKRRAELGQTAPWTSVFPTIHLEPGNEVWNKGDFYGETIADPLVYAQYADQLFAAARANKAYQPAKFDLVLGGWGFVPWWSREELSVATKNDSIDAGPYFFTDFNDASSTEAIFGPMFAEPEYLDSTAYGYMKEQAGISANAPHPANLEVYEVNLSTTAGRATQEQINQVVPSVGAGIAALDHMLLMLRDLGITTQSLFSIEGYRFLMDKGPPHRTTPLWGSVIDMGGPTNRRRPSYLAEELVNEAILPQMLKTELSGANPTWDQAPSENDKIALNPAHLLQTFAFADGSRRSVILINLSRTDSLPIVLAGADAPHGTVRQGRLTSAHITDSNETATQVGLTHVELPDFDPSKPYLLPPFSITTLLWQTR